MKFFKTLIFLSCFLLLPAISFASNTINADPSSVTISAIDSAWTWTTTYTSGADKGGKKASYILFNPGATDDICVIRDGGASGPILFRVKCADAYDQRVLYFFKEERIRPYLDVTEGAPNAGAFVTIKWAEGD